MVNWGGSPLLALAPGNGSRRFCRQAMRNRWDHFQYTTAPLNRMLGFSSEEAARR